MIENIDMTDVAKGFEAAYTRGYIDGLEAAANTVVDQFTDRTTLAEILRDQADKLKGELK
jgi:hypothetical protein